jgi:hypothetical protein
VADPPRLVDWIRLNLKGSRVGLVRRFAVSELALLHRLYQREREQARAGEHADGSDSSMASGYALSDETGLSDGATYRAIRTLQVTGLVQQLRSRKSDLNPGVQWRPVGLTTSGRYACKALAGDENTKWFGEDFKKCPDEKANT